MELNEKKLGLPWKTSEPSGAYVRDKNGQTVYDLHFAAKAANNHFLLLRALRNLHAAARDLSTRHPDHIAAMNEAARVLKSCE